MDSQQETNQPSFGSRERNFVLGVVARLLRDRDQAEDVAQDALLLAFRHRARFRGESRFTTWLYRIATTTALMHLRKQRSRGKHDDLAEAGVCEFVAAPALDPERQLIVEEELALTLRCLAEIGRTCGAVVRMRFAEGYSTSEVGKALGIKVDAAKSRARRGRAALRATLRPRLQRSGG